MKLALDPYMHRHLSLPEVCRLTAELGYDGVELSPRPDFLEWWVMPRATPERRAEFKKALKDHSLTLITLQPMYRWASPFEDERQMAVRYWKKAIEIAVDMGCSPMVSEFGRGTSPERSRTLAPASESREVREAAWWRSIEELTPILEKEGITLSVEPHPEDWVETFHPAFDIIRMVGSKAVKMSYIAPHTFFYSAGDPSRMAAMLREAAPILHHVRVADTLNHAASSGNRYIANPPDPAIRVHQHLDIGQGEIDWETFFRTLSEIKFDGIYSSCVFAWEDRAEASSRFMAEEIRRYVKKYA